MNTDPEIFDSNLHLARDRWPDLADLLEKTLPTHGRVEASRSGEPTLRMPTDSDDEIWIHSRYRPIEEAQRQVEDLEIAPNDSVFILGFGLGYAALEIVRKAPSTALIVVIEKDPEVLRHAFESHALDEFLEHPGADIFVGASRMKLFALLEKHGSRACSGAMRRFVHPASRQASPSYYDEMGEGLGDFSRHAAVMVRSALYLSRVSIQNQFRNVPEYLRSPGIGCLKNRFRGYPAVVVGAGPSLEKNVEELRAFQGRGVIIAVSTAFKVLLGRGIRPDFTAIVDYHDLSSRYFEDVPAEAAVPIVCDPKASAAAVSSYAGTKLFCDDTLMNTLFDGVPGERGELVLGATVAHTAFDAAVQFGCDPIIVAGLDLSFPGGRMHAAGTAKQQQHMSETNRFYSFEMKEWEWFLLFRKTLMPVPGNVEDEVLTNDTFGSLLREFELLFQNSGRKIIDATEGGARKKCAEQMTLRDAVATHATKTIPPEFFDLSAAQPTDDELDARHEKMRDALEARLDEVAELATLYRRAIKLLEKVLKITRKGEPANNKVLRVHEIREEIKKHDFLYYVLNSLAQSDLFLRARNDRDIEGEEHEGVERQERQASRDLDYIRGLAKALEFISDLLEELRSKLEECRRPARA